MATRSLTALQAGSTFNAKPAPPSIPQKYIGRPYKDFLTPALHRRFTKATGIVLTLCWLEASFLSDAGWFWSWFPLSLTGLRALLLFMPSLAIFIVRVANLHVGERTFDSGFENLLQRLVGAELVRTLSTIFWHMFSGWFFGEVYIWSQGHNAALGIVDPGRAYERPRVNENPIYLRSFLMILAMTRACLHMTWDLDRIPISLETSQSTTRSTSSENSPPKPSSPLQHLLRETGPILKNTAQVSLITLVFSIPTYFMVIRRTAWDVNHFLASIVFHQLPPNSGPVGIIQLGRLGRQAVTSAVMLMLLWEVSNVAFTVYVTEPPLKKGQPLTSEVKDARGVILSTSKDPNGSLMRGLNAKREVPKSFALWELYLICTDYPSRRKTLFVEVDRSGRPPGFETTCTQVVRSCLGEIQNINSRIGIAQRPILSKKEIEAKEQERRQQDLVTAAERQEKLGLPRIADEGVYQDRALTQASKKSAVFNSVGQMAKNIGQSPGAPNPVRDNARRALQYGADQALGRDVQAQLDPAHVLQGVNTRMVQFLDSPFGAFFRQTFSGRARAVIFGGPHSAEVDIIHAARSVVKMAVDSIREDDYGQVSKTVPDIVRTFTAAITGVQQFVGTLAPHWTDVKFHEARSAASSRDVQAIRNLVNELKTGLEQVILTFDEYAGTVGLTKKEIREAKEAVGRGPEMTRA